MYADLHPGKVRMVLSAAVIRTETVKYTNVYSHLVQNAVFKDTQELSENTERYRMGFPDAVHLFNTQLVS